MLLEEMTSGKTIVLDESPVLAELATAMAQSARGGVPVAVPKALAEEARRHRTTLRSRGEVSSPPKPARWRNAGGFVLRTQHRFRPVRKRAAEGVALD